MIVFVFYVRGVHQEKNLGYAMYVYAGYVRIPTYTHTFTNAYTLTHTHTHTHALSPPKLLGPCIRLNKHTHTHTQTHTHTTTTTKAAGPTPGPSTRRRRLNPSGRSVARV
jgi:hypothetical protein